MLRQEMQLVPAAIIFFNPCRFDVNLWALCCFVSDKKYPDSLSNNIITAHVLSISLCSRVMSCASSCLNGGCVGIVFSVTTDFNFFTYFFITLPINQHYHDILNQSLTLPLMW